MTKAPSPFLPNTTIQYAWDSVCITTAQECPRRYQYKIIQGWQSKNPNTAIALIFGILVHSGIEQYHRVRALGRSWDEAVHAALAYVMSKAENGTTLYSKLPTEDDYQDDKAAAAKDDEDDGIDLRNSRVRTRYYLFRALVWYFEQYRYDTMQVYVLQNAKPAVELSFRVPVGFSLTSGHDVLLSGHLDKVIRFNDQLYVSDIKTTKSITASWRADFDLSHQMSGYILGGNLALNEPVHGAVIDGIALQVGGVKFARHFTHRTKSQLGEYLHGFQLLVERYEQYSLNNYWPMNTSFCWRCEYKDVCKQPPEMRQGYLNHFFERKAAWNPLASR